MASKKSNNPDDLLAQLDDLSTQSQPKPRTARPAANRAPRSNQGNTSQNEQDLLAELGNLAQRPSSRPGTPSLRSSAKPAPSTGTQSPKRAGTPSASRLSEDNKTSDRKSADSTRSSGNGAAFTPATTTADDSPAEEHPTQAQDETPQPQQTSGGGWGGWFTSIATNAVSTASAQVKQLQAQAAHEASQRGITIPADAKALASNPSIFLSGFGVSTDTLGNIRNMAMPTFQNILQTIAPPISSHERLAVHITHDLRGYPSLDPTIYRVFERVMSQVEGGDLIVVQKGEEAGPKRTSRDVSSRMGIISMSGAWSDGPWWRSSGARSTNAVRGLPEGQKLARASAEGYASDFFKEKGGVEEAAKRATETLGESNPTRDSQIFLAVQAVTITTEDSETSNEEFVFAIYLHDPIHGIAFHAMSQAVPMQWIQWLDGTIQGDGESLPESIQEIIESGGVDPREWASEWVEETLSLAAGVVAQRYVARRMGVGEGASKGKAKLRAEVNTAVMAESGGGEAARAGI